MLGHDIVEDADAVRAVSLTGQLASVDEDLTGLENLILLGRLLGLKRTGARRARSSCSRRSASPTPPASWSSSTRRHAPPARHRRGLVVTLQVMFLDEPTAGLDPRSRNQVWDIVRYLVAEGTTILLCTQYLDEADQLADGIAVIDHGTVIAEGTPAQLKASVGGGALRRLLDPDQRPEAERVLSRELDAVHLEPDPAALPALAPPPAAPPRRLPSCRAPGRGRRLLAGTAEPRRGLSGADGSLRRAGVRRARVVREDTVREEQVA